MRHSPTAPATLPPAPGSLLQLEEPEALPGSERCRDACRRRREEEEEEGEPAELTLRLPETDPEAARFSILFTGTVISHLAESALLAHLSSQMFLFRLICLYS